MKVLLLVLHILLFVKVNFWKWDCVKCSPLKFFAYCLQLDLRFGNILFYFFNGYSLVCMPSWMTRSEREDYTNNTRSKKTDSILKYFLIDMHINILLTIESKILRWTQRKLGLSNTKQICSLGLKQNVGFWWATLILWTIILQLIYSLFLPYQSQNFLQLSNLRTTV
jgi:hypothetical protein